MRVLVLSPATTCISKMELNTFTWNYFMNILIKNIKIQSQKLKAIKTN